MEIVLKSLLISFTIQMAFFALAAKFRTDKVTDLSYGLGFITLSIYLLYSNNSAGIVQSTISILVIFWGIRLISYLFLRILKTGKDERFDGIRENLLKFLKFWTLQAVAVWVIMLPATIVVSKNTHLDYSFNLYIGFVIWLTGLITETVADQQKFDFKSDPKNEDKWIETGIWKYSRHPNYFGEMLCWWGIYVISLPYLKGAENFAVISPLFISSILLFVSGIPLLEKKYNEKYKNNEDYQYYKRRTSLLIPLPVKKG